MPNIDLILLILLGGFVLYGFWFGLIHTLGGLVGVVVGSLFAGQLYEPIARWILSLFGGDPNLVRAIAFILAFILITRFVGFGFWILEQIFRVISVVPFLKTINRLAGAGLGFAEGVFLLGGILFILARFPTVIPFQKQLRTSSTARYLVRTYSIMVPLLPKTLRDFDPATYFQKK